jgi:hypothetical protein
MADVTEEMERSWNELSRFQEDLRGVFGARATGFSVELKNHLCELWSRAQGKKPEWDFTEIGEPMTEELEQEIDNLLLEMLGEDN